MNIPTSVELAKQITDFSGQITEQSLYDVNLALYQLQSFYNSTNPQCTYFHYESEKTHLDQAFTTPKFMQSLVNLSMFNVTLPNNKANHVLELIISIRNNSRQCLLKIQRIEDMCTQLQLRQSRYASALSMIFATAGGYSSELINGISNALYIFNGFLNQFHKDRFYSRDIYFPPFMSFYYEQIEEEGGNEEIQAHFFNKVKDNIWMEAKKTIDEIINVRIYDPRRINWHH